MTESLNPETDKHAERRQKIAEEMRWAEEAHSQADNDYERLEIEREQDRLEEELASFDEPDA